MAKEILDSGRRGGERAASSRRTRVARSRFEQLRRWKLAASWAAVFWFPLAVYLLSIGRARPSLAVALAGVVFSGAARLVVWSARCPSCGESFRARRGGFRRIWDEASCAACGLSLFGLRREAE